MNTLIRQRTPMILAALLGGTLLIGTSFADQGGHSTHHMTETATTDTAPGAMSVTRFPAIQERMQLMRQIQDPAERMRLMEEQMADMEGMMQAMPAGCPMMSGDMPRGPGMMQGGMPGMMGMEGGMQGSAPELMQQRMEMMEKRMEMMEQRMQPQSPTLTR